MSEPTSREVRLCSWEVLPQAQIESLGPISIEFIAQGVGDFRAAGRHVALLAYGRTSNRADFTAVLRERRGTCSTKHALLAALALEQKLPATLTLGIYEMNERNTPGVGAVLEAHGLASILEAHCYLTHEGMRVDVTRSRAAPASMIFLHEEAIAPEQIGDYKVSLHRQFLKQWMDRNAVAAGQRSLEELWRIREACIAALTQ